jgi:predicted DNA-binding transcriptional regulator AlpA
LEQSASGREGRISDRLPPRCLDDRPEMIIRRATDRRPLVRLALSRAELALAIGVGVGSVDHMVREGALPPPRKWHSRRLWLVSEVEAYMNEWPSAIDIRHVTYLGQSDTGSRSGSDFAGRFESVSHAAGGYLPNNDAERKSSEGAAIEPGHIGSWSQADEDSWRASIVDSPLNKRERKALAQMAAYGVGVPVHWSKIAECGPATEERLQVRGYLKIGYQAKYPDRIDSYLLTDAGLAAFEGL